jgi:hypothetical protein
VTITAKSARRAAVVLLAALAAGCTRPRVGVPAAAPRWVGTWMAAPQLTEPRNLPPEPGLRGSTLRQVVRVSLGGSRIRVRFSNAFGSAPVTIAAARIAHSAGASAIRADSDRPLTFSG